MQDSLGGNAKTVMIANFGPADYNYDETTNTLRYANRAKNIKNKPKINENPKDALLRQYQLQLEDLRRQLADGGDGEDQGPAEATPGRPMSPGKLARIQASIDEDRRKLQADGSMEADMRKRTADGLAENQRLLDAARGECDAKMLRVAELEAQIKRGGGTQAMEWADKQAHLLATAQVERQRQDESEAQLRADILAREEEAGELEEHYASLQEEDAGKTRRLKKVRSYGD